MWPRLTILTLLVVVVLSGCATTTPKISHAHVGHALDAWGDTPGEEGLLVVAERDARAALDQSGVATRPGTPLDAIRDAVARAMHALDPQRGAGEGGSGYGMIKALVGAGDHIEFAAASPDSSQNIADASRDFRAHSSVILDRAELMLEFGELLDDVSAVDEARSLAGEIHTLARHNVEGVDEDGDGVIGSQPSEYGLRQLRRDLEVAIDSEVPAYQPVPRRYLLGLIRLPNGLWEYDLSSQSSVDRNY